MGLVSNHRNKASISIKQAVIFLPVEGLVFNLWKMQHLWSTIMLISTIKQGVPVFYPSAYLALHLGRSSRLLQINTAKQHPWFPLPHLFPKPHLSKGHHWPFTYVKSLEIIFVFSFPLLPAPINPISFTWGVGGESIHKVNSINRSYYLLIASVSSLMSPLACTRATPSKLMSLPLPWPL